ncbi:MAG: ATP-dependent DNA helicase [Alphaproteobacteria bacterium]|nr:ATP-dependent DNA helicase [Alphaproteobacteria bacterium]
MALARRSPASPRLPDAPVLVAGHRSAAWLWPDGSIEQLSHKAAGARLSRPATAAGSGEPHLPIVCHMPQAARRLGIDRFPALDVLELWAFVQPARFALPTPRGIAIALGLAGPDDPPSIARDATLLLDATALLLEDLRSGDMERGPAERDAVPGIAAAMARAGWAWGPSVLATLGHGGGAGGGARGSEADGEPGSTLTVRAVRSAVAVWDRLQEWTEEAPPPAPSSLPVDPSEARSRLGALLGSAAEQRPSQADYASAATAAFAPRDLPDAPHLVLAEAGTGVGKTLGYVAPASLWAERNKGPVWVSTYTRNLQHQIDGELDRLYPDPVEKARRVVLRKGRENYLCVLNLEEAMTQSLGQMGGIVNPDAIALGLMGRWAGATRDGALTGGDFPGWLSDLIGRNRTMGLADRRGECIYSACSHYHRCFIERSIRRARRADIVVANHALVLVQAALGGLDDAHVPTRYVFDEGHHLFEAADGAFSGHLTGQETVDLARWLLGADARGAGGARSRARGLRRRVEDLVADDPEAQAHLDAALKAARCLPTEGWLGRLRDGPTEPGGLGAAPDAGIDAPGGQAELFLARVRRQVYARSDSAHAPYGLECDTRPLGDGVAEAARFLDAALERLSRPLIALAERLKAQLDDEAERLESQQRARIESVVRGILRRAEVEIGGWRSMLQSLAGQTDPAFVDWMAVERIDGRDVDVGMHRHWIDPMLPFADLVARKAHGILVTSATLTDSSGDLAADWLTAEARAGSRHLPLPAVRVAVPSPFDYPARTRVFVVKDVRKDELDQVAAAYRTLFLAARGGGLGLFTAIQRLRAVHGRISGALEEAGIPLLAQHVDAIDTGTLVDIFRADEDACLLGTDALRDGVDVPGRSLRLIVFDRVPWPRPDILHRARRQAHPSEAGGPKGYDDMITRLRLKQAFGRLIRRADDIGVFVLLDPMMPTRLLTAFPEGVPVERCGLAEATEKTRAFLGADGT